MPNRDRPARISQEDWDNADVPEWTEAEAAQAVPFGEMFPAQLASSKEPGRPPSDAPKIHIGFRLAPDVVEGVRATGRGYNARVEKVLRDALAKRRL